MLSWLSRKERTHKVVLIFFAVLMAVSLVAFYAPSRGGAAMDSTKSTEPLATIGDGSVTVGDLVRQKQMYSRFGMTNMAQLGGNRGLLNGLIRNEVEAQEAKRLGLIPSDAEVAEYIRKQHKDASGSFNVENYKKSVAAQFGSVSDYEERIRNVLATQKLNAFVTSGVSVSADDVKEDYKRQNTSFDLTYAIVSADKLVEKVTLSEEEQRKYFEDHKTDFRFTTPSKKVRYLYIETSKVGEKLNITDEELKKEYDTLNIESKQAGNKVQQIVLKVAREDLDEQVKTKATELVAKLRGDKTTVTEEAFAEAAKGNSEDVTTAKNGGWLPNVVRKNPNKPSDPLQQTLNMQPGEVTEPIKHGNAYYIFRRGETIPKTFEEAKKELLVSSRNRKAYNATKELATKAAGRMKETKDVRKVAEEFATDANMKPDDMVRETPLIKPGDDVPGIGTSADFESALESLKLGDVGEPVNIKDGFAVPVIIEYKDANYEPTFEEVKDQVAKTARQARAKEQLEQVAKEIANVGKPADIKAVAEKYGLEVKDETSYKVSSPLGSLGISNTLQEAIYALKADELTKTPVKVGEQWAVVGVKKRTDADMNEFEKQREQLTQTALSTRRNEVYQDYIQAARDRMEREGKIKIIEERLTQLAEDDPPAFAPNFPFQN